ncbi:MAG: hypothetical protein KC431_23305 [Myxococcales bacterium]|nr:hypothetical protein [Myxococcales bacterium]
MTHAMNLHRPLVLTLAACLLAPALTACINDGAGDDEANDDGNDEEPPALGETPLPACDAAFFAYEQIVAELVLPNPDPAYVIELYRGADPDFGGESPVAGGTALQRWLREVDARLGRVDAGVLIDDAAIEAKLEEALVEEDPVTRKLLLIDVVQIMRAVASLDVRERLAVVSDVLPDPQRDPSLLRAEWDQAYCVWSGTLAPLAEEAAGLAIPGDSPWQAQIDQAFVDGHAGIEGPDEPWAPDEWATKPAKQIVEKGDFAVIERLVVERARTAAQAGDPAPAREALGLFAILEDRIAGRNTPAIEPIQAMLAGDPAAIDADWLQDQLAIAFVKRARKYCDEAVEAGAVGTADSYKGAWEGTIYTQIVLPLMHARLDGFDAEAYMQLWADYREALKNDDAAAAVELAPQLIGPNCELQAALGIAQCTGSDDEPG